MLVITGPNGGGKSTLAKYLPALREANGGEIFLDEENITGYDIDHHAKRRHRLCIPAAAAF